MPVQATRLETEEDVRRALAAYRPEATAKSPAAPMASPADDAPTLFRPFLRPPTPILTICDDGLDDGESVRIRKEQFVIGRTEGDLVVPHDGQMSSRHAAIRRTVVKEKMRWVLADLKSTNGTFVRIGHAVLSDGCEFIVGRTRLRFESKSPGSAAPAGQANMRGAMQATQLWQAPSDVADSPAIIEMASEGAGRHLHLSAPEVWLGKDASHCQLLLPADPYVSARHARIRQDDEGRWVLENNKSVNGVWLKVDRIAFRGSCRFMLGEQRFVVSVP